MLPAEVLGFLLSGSLERFFEGELVQAYEDGSTEYFVYCFDALLGMRLASGGIRVTLDMIHKDFDDVMDETINRYTQVSPLALSSQMESYLAFSEAAPVFKSFLERDPSGRELVNMFVGVAERIPIRTTESSLVPGIQEYVVAGAKLYQEIYELAYELYRDTYPPEIDSS